MKHDGDSFGFPIQFYYSSNMHVYIENKLAIFYTTTAKQQMQSNFSSLIDVSAVIYIIYLCFCLDFWTK